MSYGFSRDQWYNYVADRSHPPVASAVVEKPEYDPDHVYAWKPANNYKGWKLIARGEAGVDNAEVIQSAYDYVYNQGKGGIIFIKSGEYIINTPLKLLTGYRNHPVLVGEHRDDTVLKAGTTMDRMIDLRESTFNVIKNLMLDGDNKVTTLIDCKKETQTYMGLRLEWVSLARATIGLDLTLTDGIFCREVTTISCTRGVVFGESADDSNNNNTGSGLYIFERCELHGDNGLRTYGNGTKSIYLIGCSVDLVYVSGRAHVDAINCYAEGDLYANFNGKEIGGDRPSLTVVGGHYRNSAENPNIRGYWDTVRIFGGKWYTAGTQNISKLHINKLVVEGRPDFNADGLYKNSGTATFSGDGSTTQFKIAHGLVSTPSKVLVTPMSEDASGDFYVTADNTYIYINYKTAPPSGTDNVKVSWYAEI